MKVPFKHEVLQQAIKVEKQNKQSQEALIAILQRFRTHLANPGCVDEALIAALEEDVQEVEIRV